MEVLRVEADAPDDSALLAAAEAVLRGGVIAFPTDTLYGLGCSLFDVSAVEMVARLKRRDPSLAVISLIPEVRQVDGLAVDITPVARRLMERHWPGPLSLIFRAAPIVPPRVRGAGGTVALRVLSAHRTPELTVDYVRDAAARGVQVFIACAGMANHLAGVVAAHTLRPVIGVPLASGPLAGFDALLSTVQMPPGIPVATVAVDGARNAGLLAARILALHDPDLAQRLEAALAAERSRYSATEEPGVA